MRAFPAARLRVTADVSPPPAREHAGMARTYRLTPARRAVNVLVRGLLRIGIAPRGMVLLTVVGRRSGAPRTTPVSLVESDAGQRWLVAPYGAVGWVLNARAAGKVRLGRGRRSENLDIDEVGPEEAAGVLRTYLRDVRVVRPFFDVASDSPDDAFAAEAPRHPVFRLRQSSTP
jgi:deazaflavin-dependent oxidoreductase (nitroreductase family)